jgi:hypothetical protein
VWASIGPRRRAGQIAAGMRAARRHP